jgi:ferredoxin-NADP reductase
VGTYIAKLTKREQIAEDTIACYFDRPVGFEFVAGQSMDFTLIDPPQTDGEGNTRTFSLASAPDAPHLMAATRVRDTAFKRTLRTLPLGTEVSLEGPAGSMTLHRKATRPAVLLAGGIGITPFRSMICQATNAVAGPPIYLFYSNRRPEDAAFLAELQQLAGQHPKFSLIATMTNMERSRVAWNGATGYINHEMLARSVSSLAQAVYYIAGPPALVTAMKNMLGKAGVDEEEINSEDFSGY